MANNPNEKELLLRLAQSLRDELNVQMNSGMKAATDARPYAKRYAVLRERILTLGIKDSDKFVPELQKGIYNSEFGIGLVADTERNVSYFDELMVATGQMVGFLEVIQKNSMKVLTELEEFLFKNLRKNVIVQPTEEKDIQNIIEIMLNTKGYTFEREKVRISYSSKTFIPDFTFEDLNAALEVKFCTTNKKENDLVDEINADILAYSTKYLNLTFLIYDLGIIRDTELFSKDIEKNTPRIKVLVVKQ